MQIKAMTYGDLQAAVLDSDEVVVVVVDSGGGSGNSNCLLIPLFPSTLWLSLSLSLSLSLVFGLTRQLPLNVSKSSPLLALIFRQPKAFLPCYSVSFFSGSFP